MMERAMMIDMHTHFIPPELVADARAGRALDRLAIESRDGMEWLVHPQGSRYPLVPAFFDAGAKLEQMDALGLDASVLSLTPTLFFYWLEAAAAREFCRLANESLARLVARSDRLHGLATVPLQDPGAAEAELRHAVTTLGLRGVEIGTTMEDVPLDDRRFDSFFAAAAELGVPVMLHPHSVRTRPRLADFYMADLTGNPMDTCIAATRLMLSGFLDRHPALKLVLVHAGGFLPYQIGRLDHGFRVRTETRAAIAAPPSTYLRRFWYDTITHAGKPFEFLVELVGADRLMVGTDLPFDMADQRFRTYLSTGAYALAPVTRAAISAGTAVDLFGLPSARA
jgi:aminocarboxymuconate-semialdehyde decarboxylase